MRKALLAGASLLSAFVGAGAAQSAIVVTLDGVAAVSGGYRYTYEIVLQNGSGLSAAAPNSSDGKSYGTTITIFDFAGYLANSVVVNDFQTGLTGGSLAGTATLTTNTPGLQKNPGEVDNGSIYNLNFFYSGADFDTTVGAGTDIVLGHVSAVSIYNTTSNVSYSGIDVKSANGNAEFFSTTTRGPVAAVPEAATWAMMVMGFGLVGAGLRSRRSRPSFVTFG